MIHHVVDETAIYDRASIRTLWGIPDRSISREIRLGRLTVYQRCNRQWFLGADLLEWLKAGRVRPNGADADDLDDGSKD